MSNNNNNYKRQFLDPITTLCKITLIYFYPKKTKIRILNHTVNLVLDNYTELLYRNWYRDNRGDICVLFPIFIRFIELYLLEKKRRAVGIIDDNNKIQDSDLSSDQLCYKYLRKLASYAIHGLQELQKTYDYDNVVFVLQYYISLLTDGINNKYSCENLPEHLRTMTKDNLVDNEKVQKIWTDEHIIEIGKTFVSCFEAKEKHDEVLLESNKKKILDILEKHDDIFRNMVKNNE